MLTLMIALGVLLAAFILYLALFFCTQPRRPDL
jgi:hypothetical protein